MRPIAEAAAPAARPRPGTRGAPVTDAVWLSAVVLGAVALAGVVATGAVLAGQESVVTTYAAASTAAAVATLAAGLALALAGLVAGLYPPAATAGTLVAAAGLAWLAPVWTGWAGHPAARSVAMVAAPFLLPLLIHLLLSAVAGGRGSGAAGRGERAARADRAARIAVGTGYAVTGAVSLGQALFRDPFLDRYCWSNCTDNVFLVRPVPELARVLAAGWLRFTIVAGVLAVAVAAWRLARARTAETRILLVPTAFAIAAEAGYAGLLVLEPAEDPARAAFQAVHLARAVALTGVAAGLAWTVERAWRRRRAVARLADELGAVPPLGSLQAALAKSLGDERLTVAYWLPGAGRHIDAAGLPVDPAATSDRAVISVRRGGEPIATVTHSRTLYGEHQLAEQIGAAARLAIDNERLQAEVLAHLHDLRASRARIVEAADEARRQLERNLHDGAQQSMIALLFELRLAQADAERAGDDELCAVLRAAVGEATAAVDELRGLAHGIFPAILDEAGLRAALLTLADNAAAPVEITGALDGRLGGAERAAYLVVSGVVAAAERNADAAATARGAPPSERPPAGTVRVRMDQQADRLLISVDGVPADRYIHLADRVGAVGGELTFTNGRLKAEIPCA